MSDKSKYQTEQKNVPIIPVYLQQKLKSEIISQAQKTLRAKQSLNNPSIIRSLKKELSDMVDEVQSKLNPGPSRAQVDSAVGSNVIHQTTTVKPYKLQSSKL